MLQRRENRGWGKAHQTTPRKLVLVTMTAGFQVHRSRFNGVNGGTGFVTAEKKEANLVLYC